MQIKAACFFLLGPADRGKWACRVPADIPVGRRSSDGAGVAHAQHLAESATLALQSGKLPIKGGQSPVGTDVINLHLIHGRESRPQSALCK